MEKVSLPIKTKIAAWIMIVSGILGILNIKAYGFFMFSGATPFGTAWALSTVNGIITLLILITPLISIFSYVLALIYFAGTFFVAPVSLLFRKKWAWWFIIFSLSISLIILLYLLYSYVFGTLRECEVISIFYPFTLLILLLLDRKNFWKIAT